MNKKNILTKNNLMIKINTETHKHKSMNDALKDDEVLLWGLNQVDSLILASYELNYFKQNIIKKINLNEQIKMSINKKIICEKTNDIQYNPSNTYNHCDLQFLINEYDRIDYDLSMMKELNDEFNNLLDVQDKLGDLIDELENNPESNVEGSNNNLIILDNLDVDMEIEINKNKTKKITNKKIKLKPYYWIGKIPDGYIAATEEEAILSKKVSYFGKKKVSRELYNLHFVTGTLFIKNLNLKEINLKIVALKGKLSYYKKQHQYYKISLDSDNISSNSSIEIGYKIEEIIECHKKTVDILKKFIEYQKTLNLSIIKEKKTIIKEKKIKKINNIIKLTK